jgi:L-galactose dehydrogenase/L-glyceraldehyde 3-phosphate reductase
MEYRTLGKTGLTVSTLGFGCGGVGGLLVAGEYKTMLRVVERAIEAGINYFDTAQEYGNGRSEANLGKVLQALKPEVVVGTKVQLTAANMERIEAAIIEGAEVSLRRLQLERLDLFQLHTAITPLRQPDQGWVGVADLGPVISAFQKLQAQGKIRYYGINGLGDTGALHQAVAESGADTIQTCYSLLNPSAGYKMSPNFHFQDYRQLIDRAAERQMGVIAFRVLAGGALSGTTSRHPVAARSVETIASNASFEADAAQAGSFQFLIDNGWADSLVEAAIRFVLNHPGISTAPIGLSSLDQLEQAIAAIEKGPLPPAALDQLSGVWADLKN